jgi:predicted Rossmann fold flavoprotein
MRIAVIGAGAAGFFAAITAKNRRPETEVVLLEAGSKVLSKVRISGGGRCNLTHACFDPKELSANYPRGSKELRQAFSRFMSGDTVAWFEERGVALKTEPDGRMFPVTDDSATVIDCLVGAAERAGVLLRKEYPVKRIIPTDAGFLLAGPAEKEEHFDRVLIATGGHPRREGFEWIEKLGHTVVSPVPSLFTFNLPSEPLTGLMGLSMPSARISLPELRLQATGPLLITHWGLSGPVILKLSALAARPLAERKYDFKVYIDWNNSGTADEMREHLAGFRKSNISSHVSSAPPVPMPRRLWTFLLERSGVRQGLNWSDLRKEETEAIVRVMVDDGYHARGKTTFKEEFVTCGGVSLKEVDFRTMESKVVPGLFFAGEVLDIDGLTGGFNFQAAWTTGYIAGTSMVSD